MKKEQTKEKQVLRNVKMDASVNFTANGDINICPCPWEDEKEATTGGRRVRYRGGVEVDSDGRTRVKRYLDGTNGPKHDTLFETAHGAVKMTRPQLSPSKHGRRDLCRESVYVTFRFPKKYGVTQIKALYKDESEAIVAFLKTRKEETIWE